MKSKIIRSLILATMILLCIVACTDLTPMVDEMLYTAIVEAQEKESSSKKDQTDTDDTTSNDDDDSDSSDSDSDSGSSNSGSSSGSGSTGNTDDDDDSSDSNSSGSGSTGNTDDDDDDDSDSSDSNSGSSNSGSSSGSGSSSSGSNVTTDTEDDDVGYDSSITFTSDADDYDGEISSATGTEEGYEYVDLGLTSGLMWARMNIGAEAPEECGSYYAWGEITTKDEYSDDNCANCGLQIDDIIGNPEYDAAAAILGGHWRMPDTDEFQELIDECDWDWVKYNDVTGYVVTGPNGSSIFLPTSGYMYLSTLYYESSKGLYWSAIADTADTDMAYHLYFYSTKYDYNSFWNYRRNGRVIRAIYDEDFEYEEEVSYTVSDATGTDENGYEYVDLGLSSGLKWARVNIGADEPEDYGDYYAWGETETKDTYTSSNSVTYGVEMVDFSGDPEYDAAQANWGGHWRMPTQKEIGELIDECDIEIVTISSGDTIVIFTGSNGNSILLPMTGYYSNSYYSNCLFCGRSSASAHLNYWSSTPYTTSLSCVLTTSAKSNHNYVVTRTMGLPIRAIYDEDFEYEEASTDTVGTEFATSDFYYKITSSSEVCVSYWPDDNDAVSALNAKSYVGDMSIPSSVTYNGTTYSVTSINDSTFKKCTSLTSISIPESVTSIGDEAFYNCMSLTSISIPENVTSIGSDTFHYCSSLTSITIPDGVTSIGSGTFFDCENLASVTFGDNSALTSIGNFAFYYCISLTSITIPESVTSIGEMAFFDCASLASVTFGDNSALKSIGSTAFSGCTSLTDITIPESVASISTYAFEGCTSLANVTCLATSPPTIYESSFSYVTATLHVPSSALSDYQSADYWSDFSEILGDAD